MLADIVGYLVPGGKPQCGSVHDELAEKRTALQEFKEKHQEDLKELKRMEDEHLYEEVEMDEDDGLEPSAKN